MLTDRRRQHITLACRIVVALLFIFSGLSKAIDPWGTSFVVEEYLRAYSAEWLVGGSIALSIVLSGAELMLGLLIALGILPRLSSIVAFATMCLFTVITLLSATVFTVADCGCFGDVVKLSPWLTFAKNIILLPFAALLWWFSRPAEWFTLSRRQLIYTAATAVISFGIGIYSYLYLPLIDLSSYREGINLYELVYGSEEQASEGEDTYISKSTESGDLREFTLEELESLDDTWEWVETHEGSVATAESPAENTLFISDSEGDATRDILSRQGAVYLICITDFDAIPMSCARRLERVVRRAMDNDDLVIILTPEYLRGITYYSFAESPLVRCYNIDAREMKNLLRANNGLVVLHNAIITDKLNCRSIDF